MPDDLIKKNVNWLERSIIQIIFLIAFMCKMGAVLFDTVIFQQIYPEPAKLKTSICHNHR